MLGEKGLQLADDVGMTAELEVGLDPFLEDGESKRFQTSGLVLGKGFVHDLDQRRPAPETECIPEQPCSVGRAVVAKRLLSLLVQMREALQIQLLVVEAQHVAGSGRDEHPFA
jgi:hypothetical protein